MAHLADTCCARCSATVVNILRVEVSDEPRPRPDSTVTVHASCARCGLQGSLETTLLEYEESDDLPGDWV